jgi:hypothetical protein
MRLSCLRIKIVANSHALHPSDSNEYQRPNAKAQRRGQNDLKPLVEPKSCNAPLAPRPLQRVVRWRLVRAQDAHGTPIGSLRRRSLGSLPGVDSPPAKR